MSDLTVTDRSPNASALIARLPRGLARVAFDPRWLLLPALLAVWAGAILTWGLPALTIPFVLAAPLCLGMLVALTRG